MEVQKHSLEQDLHELRERLGHVSRQLGNAAGDIAAKEVTIVNLRGTITDSYITLLAIRSYALMIHW